MNDIPLCQKCGAQHKTWNKLARCRYPFVAWVAGEGAWVSMYKSHSGSTIMLSATREEAEFNKDNCPSDNVIVFHLGGAIRNRPVIKKG